MRILIITYSYYPHLSARSFRWTSIANYWAKQGIEIDVVCAGDSTLQYKKKGGDNIHVHRVKDVTAKFKNNVEVKQDTNVEKKKTSILSSLKHFAVKKVIEIIRWPDGIWLWIRPAYKASKALLEINKYDAVVTVALPFSSHVVGLLLKLDKKQIPWITDFGDPFSVNDVSFNNDFLYNRFSKKKEKEVIEKSKMVSVTTEETIYEYTSKLGVEKDFFSVMPPLFDNDYLELYRSKNKTRVKDEQKVKVLYTGAFHKGIRDPKFLLEIFSKLQGEEVNSGKKIELHVYGKLNDCKDMFDGYLDSNDWLFIHGEVSKSMLMEAYTKADVLLNVGNQTIYQVPSKVIEYMSTGIPILSFVSLEEDLSKKVLSNYPSSLVLNDKEEVSLDLLKSVVKFTFDSKMIEDEVVNSIIEKYSIEVISEQYLKLLK